MNLRLKLATIATLLLSTAVLQAGLPPSAIAAEQTALSLSASHQVVTYGDAVRLSVKGAPAGASLTLSRQRAGETSPTVVGTAVAGETGAAVWKRTPPRSAVFRVDVAGDVTGAHAEVSVGVRPKVALATVARRPLIEGQSVRVTVKVRPARPGATVRLVRRTADGWTLLREVTLGAKSQATARVRVGSPGRLLMRGEIAADADHIAGRSPLWKTTVYDKRNPYGVPARYPRLILVDLSTYTLYYHEHGNVIRVFDCVLGRPGLPTPRGHFRVYAKDPHVGGPYGPFRMRYLGMYAIHGTNEPWLLTRFPRNFSHGCTRLSNNNITWLYSRVRVGTPVWNVP